MLRTIRVEQRLSGQSWAYAILVRKSVEVEVSMKMPKLRTLLAAYAGLI
jgi:hypothetical protein